MTTELQIKNPGTDRSIALVSELSAVVLKNWEVIYLGAARLGCAIESDYYAPQRVQIGETRLHAGTGFGVKYADGWKYDGLVGPSDAQLVQTVADIQACIDAGAEDVGTNLTIQVVALSNVPA